MLKVSSVLSDTPMQSLPPLVDSYVNDVLVKSEPFCNQSFFQMVDVTDPATVDSLLQNAPDRIVNRISWKQARNSVIILLAPYPFKTLSSFDNILFINKMTSCVTKVACVVRSKQVMSVTEICDNNL